MNFVNHAQKADHSFHIQLNLAKNASHCPSSPSSPPPGLFVAPQLLSTPGHSTVTRPCWLCPTTTICITMIMFAKSKRKTRQAERLVRADRTRKYILKVYMKQSLMVNWSWTPAVPSTEHRLKSPPRGAIIGSHWSGAFSKTFDEEAAFAPRFISYASERGFLSSLLGSPVR